MLLIILFGVVCFGIYKYVSALHYQKRFGLAEKIYDATTMSKVFEAIYTDAYDSDSTAYTYDHYFQTATEWASTFRFHIVKKLTEFHSMTDLKQNHKLTLQTHDMNMDDVFPGMGTEGQRYAIELVGELEQKFQRDSAKAQDPTAFKRRRRR